MRRAGYQVNPDVSVIGYKASRLDNVEDAIDMSTYASQGIKHFIESEEAGSEVTYRCISLQDV